MMRWPLAGEDSGPKLRKVGDRGKRVRRDAAKRARAVEGRRIR
jgi:hypothetical protein